MTTANTVSVVPAEHQQHLRSQPHVGQDRWLYEHVFGPKRNGIFVDVGAYGEEGSNTHFFEKALGWTGLLIEPNTLKLDALRSTRSATVINCAIDDKPGERPFLQICGVNEQLSGLLDNYDPRWKSMLDQQHAVHGNQQNVIMVPCRRLQDVFDEHNLTHIDYMSVDTEGSEIKVLQSVDWARMDITAITVEDAHSDLVIEPLLAPFGYKLVHRQWPDQFFVKQPPS